MGRRPVVEFIEGARFRGYRPCPAVERAVELIWMVDGVPDVAADRVLPNGVVELIVNLGPPHRVVHGRSFTRHRDAWVAGLQRGPLDIASEGATNLVGIRFRPGGAAAVLALPMCEVTDQVVELDDLGVRSSGRRRSALGELRDRLFEADGDEARLAVVESTLKAILERAEPPDPRVARAIRALRRGGEPLPIAGLARELGASHKHLIALFRREVGVGPKMLGRILRFQGVLAALQARGGGARLTDLAYRHGYADQAHLSNEFRALTGIVPSAYGQARTVDPNHLLDEALGAAPRSPRLAPG